jgi:hypothetical protein
MVDFANVLGLVGAVIPDPDLGRAHGHVQLQLRHAVATGLLLAFDNEKQIVLEFAGALEDGDVYRIRFIFI